MKKNNKYDEPNDAILLLAGVAFAILNLIRLETDMALFSYLSVVPGLFVVVAVFDRLLNLK